MQTTTQSRVSRTNLCISVAALTDNDTPTTRMPAERRVAPEPKDLEVTGKTSPPKQDFGEAAERTLDKLNLARGPDDNDSCRYCYGSAQRTADSKWKSTRRQQNGMIYTIREWDRRLRGNMTTDTQQLIMLEMPDCATACAGSLQKFPSYLEATCWLMLIICQGAFL